MAVPSSSDARRFYRCAFQRYEEAKVLLEAGYGTGAVYLAGYGVECILKALILAATPVAGRGDVLKSFRGQRAHEFDWLRTKYLAAGGTRFPSDVARDFALVNDWSTDLRYSPGTVRAADAEGFLRAAVAIIRWADGRL